MKKSLVIILIFTSVIFARDINFNRGVNLTGWFQTDDVKKINFTKYTKLDFINIKSLGCDVIRLPIQLNDMTDGPPDYTIDTLFFYFLDQVVEWAEDLELHLILDNHTFDPSIPTGPEITDALIPVWQQMAAHYQDRSEIIYFEILNEPHGIEAAEWNSIQGNVIDEIRKIDQTHTIIVGGHDYNSYNSLDDMPIYSDDN
jgi:endoglucanase